MAYLGKAEPGTGVSLQCRCGGAMFLGFHGEVGRYSLPKRMEWDARQWRVEHHGPGHRVDRDDYRAPCRPATGCRQCGQPPTWPKHFYCSDVCKVTFEAEHFWDVARLAAYRRQTVYDRETQGRVGTACARCGLTGRGVLEINHIVPVAGLRYPFGCQNHSSNLEALCHECHVLVTAEQRAAGLLGT